MMHASCTCHPNDQKKPLFTRFTARAAEVSPEELHLRKVSAAALQSSAFTQLWDTEYPSRKGDNPLPALAQALSDSAHSFENHPELVTFVREMMAIELRALGRPQKDETAEDSEFRAYLTDMLAYADTLKPKIKVDDLPDDFQTALYILADKAGQNSVQPMRATWRLMKMYGTHLYEHARENKVLFGSGLAAGAGLLAYMNMTIGLGKSSFVDPAVSTDLDSLLNAENAAAANIDPEAARLSMLTLCDDHIKYLPFGEQIKGIFQSDLLLPHCARPKTLAIDAQNTLNSFYDLSRLYLDTTVKNPVLDFGGAVLPASQFRQSFMDAAQTTATYIYTIDWLENWGLHIGITGAAILATLDLSSKSKDELQEIKNSAKDFFSRTWHKTPLNYYLCASASTIALAVNDYDIKSPSIFWAGILGGISGQLIHNAVNRANAPKLAKDTMIGIRKDRALFSNALNIVSENRAEQTYIPRPANWRQHVKPAAVAGTVTLATADLTLNQGQITGAATGTAFISGTYVFSNIPQDMALHTVFIAFGMIIGGAIKIGQKVLGLDKTNKDTHEPK